MSLQNVMSLKAHEIQSRGGEGFTKEVISDNPLCRQCTGGNLINSEVAHYFYINN